MASSVDAGGGQLNSPGHWDFFLSHGQAMAGDQVKTLCLLLKEKGKKVWYDYDMENRDTAAMEEGVANSDNVVLFLSGDPEVTHGTDTRPSAGGQQGSALGWCHCCRKRQRVGTAHLISSSRPVAGVEQIGATDTATSNHDWKPTSNQDWKQWLVENGCTMEYACLYEYGAWAEIIATNRFSPTEALLRAAGRLLLWHLAQPVGYFAVFGYYHAELEGVQLGLGWAVAVREGMYAVCVLACVVVNPCFLLVDVGASVHHTQEGNRAMLGGWLFLAMYVAAPEKFVCFCLFGHSHFGLRQAFGQSYALFNMVADLCGVAALGAGLGVGFLPLALAVGYTVTTLGAVVVVGFLATNKQHTHAHMVATRVACTILLTAFVVPLLTVLEIFPEAILYAFFIALGIMLVAPFGVIFYEYCILGIRYHSPRSSRTAPLLHYMQQAPDAEVDAQVEAEAESEPKLAPEPEPEPESEHCQ